MITMKANLLSESTMESIKSDDDHSDNYKPQEHKGKLFIITKIKKHKNWSSQEDDLLLQVTNNLNEKSWTQVALFFKDKNPAQCRARYKRIRPGIVKGPWKKEEDERIIELVKESGKNWALISKMMPTRNGKQIRDRFLNYLDPQINKIKFLKQEDDKIIELYKEHGSKWSVIAKHFPGRTGDMIKNRFYSCLKRRVHIYELVKANKKNRKHKKMVGKKSAISKLASTIALSEHETTSIKKIDDIPETQKTSSYCNNFGGMNNQFLITNNNSGYQNMNSTNIINQQTQMPINYNLINNMQNMLLWYNQLHAQNNYLTTNGYTNLSIPNFQSFLQNKSDYIFQQSDEQMLTYLYHLQNFGTKN